MSGGTVPNDIVLFHYPSSPYARRVCWYLALRNIHYSECIQPVTMPRPDLAALGVKYRRTPTMAIGRDVYVDTRLILQRLEQRIPASAAHPGLSSAATAGVAALLNKFVADASVFSYAAAIIPLDAPAVRSPRFMKDRAEFMGRPWTPETMRLARPEALVHVRQSFDLAESLFADGRAWVAGTPELSFADLEGVWVFDWMISDLAPPKEYISPEIYPNVYSWRSRFMAAVRAAAARAEMPVTLKGDAAVQAVLRAGFTDGEMTVDQADPLGLAAGADVEVYPTDSGGSIHRDRGELIKLTRNEVAVSVKAPTGEEVRVHAPRWKFRIQRAKQQKL